MAERSHITRRAGFLDLAAATLGGGTLYLALMGLVAGEMSTIISVALLALAVSTGVGSVFLILRRRWAWALSIVVAALISAAGLALCFLDDLRWVGAIHAVAGVCVLGALWAGRAALVRAKS